MAYHATGLPRAGFAGVDVFFVVSGFVITTQLLRELERDERLSLLTFYGRRAKRLLPAASVVILVTAIAAWLWAPITQLRTIATDLVGAAVYVVNWVFADRAVDYLAEDTDPSPMLHYWSLAVEEQFYLIWPLLILLLVWLTRRLTSGAVPARAALAVGLTVTVLVPSFLWALHLTAADPERAFFVTTTRLWELAVGSLVALGALAWKRLPRVAAVGLAWVGLTAVVIGAFWQDGSTPWPGPGALVPVLGTAGVIIGGFVASSGGAGQLLGWRPLVWIGGLSYSLYLWHWALLIIAGWIVPELGTGERLLVVTASVVPAWLSYRFVEHPIRYAPTLNASPGTALSVGVNLSLGGVIAGLLVGGLALSAAGGASGGSQRTDGSVLHPPGKEAFEEPPVYDELTPDPLRATEDRPDHYDRGCQLSAAETTPVRCEAGDPESDTVVAVVGDSKILQWLSAIEVIADEHGWKIVSYTKSGCSATLATVQDDDGRTYQECMEWSRAVLEELRADPPDFFIASGRREVAGPTLESATTAEMVQGYVDYWSQVSELGTKVIAISDSPGPELDGLSGYECVVKHPRTANEDCTWPYEQAASSEVLEAATEQVDDATFIDLDPWICPAGTCPSVLRNIVTYRQGTHLTMTYILYLVPVVEAQLVPVVEGEGD